MVDMHFGTGPDNMDAVVDLDPYILQEHLKEIEICSKVSKSVYFIVSWLRLRIDFGGWAGAYQSIYP